VTHGWEVDTIARNGSDCRQTIGNPSRRGAAGAAHVRANRSGRSTRSVASGTDKRRHHVSAGHRSEAGGSSPTGLRLLANQAARGPTRPEARRSRTPVCEACLPNRQPICGRSRMSHRTRPSRAGQKVREPRVLLLSAIPVPFVQQIRDVISDPLTRDTPAGEKRARKSSLLVEHA
jgi:hypothetical protein